MCGEACVDMFNLQRLRHSIDELQCFFAIADESFEWFPHVDDPLHFCFDSGEVIFTDRVRTRDVVIVSMSGCRPEGQFDFGP